MTSLAGFMNAITNGHLCGLAASDRDGRGRLLGLFRKPPVLPSRCASRLARGLRLKDET